jgi:hydrogenase nickel incorporation protein HypA/HybF
MHEIGLAEGLVSIALEAGGGKKIKRIRLRVGRLQHVQRDHLQFSYDLVAAETEAAGAQIEIDAIPVTVRCKQCSDVTKPEELPFHCSSCNSLDVDLISGDEFAVSAVELDDGTLIPGRSHAES